MNKLFSNPWYAVVLCFFLTVAGYACGSEDPNPNPGDDAGTSDADSGETDAGTTDAGVRCGDTKCEGDENCDNCSLDCGCASGTVCQDKACVKDNFAEVKVVVPGDYTRTLDNYHENVWVGKLNPADYGCNGILTSFSPTVLCIETDLSLTLCKDGESTGPKCATSSKGFVVKEGQISADCSVLAQFGQEIKNWCEALPAKAKCVAGECGAGGIKVEYTTTRPDEQPLSVVYKKD